MNLHVRVPHGAAAALCVLLTACLLPTGLTAQEPTDSLRMEMERLAALVDSLRSEVDRLQATGEEEEAQDALAALREAAAAAGGAEEPETEQEDQEFVGRQRSLQALNPEISVNADVFARLDPDDVDAENFNAREFEISFQAALDPFSRAKVFVSRHGTEPSVVPFGGELEGHGDGGEAGGEEEADAHAGEGLDIEEGYVEWVSLPGGFGLKLGKFFQRLGTMNRWHRHALPFQSRSLPHLALVGDHTLSQSGVSLSWLAPFGGGGTGTYDATVEVTRSSHESLFGESSRPSVLTHLNAFWQLSGSVDLELGGTWLNGSYEDVDSFFDRNLYAVEATFNWIPPQMARHSGLTLRGGYMILDGLESEDPLLAGSGTAAGLWTMAELRLSTDWLVGARFDRVESPLEPDVTQWLVSPTLTWWQSEYVRLRAEYDLLSRFEDQSRTGQLLLQVTFAMGPHRHEAY